MGRDSGQEGSGFPPNVANPPPLRDNATQRTHTRTHDCRQAQVEALNIMCTEETVDEVLGGSPDFVLDAIDNIDTKARPALGGLTKLWEHASRACRRCALIADLLNRMWQQCQGWTARHRRCWPSRRSHALLHSCRPPLTTRQVALLAACKERGIPVLCSAGAGAKADPTRLRIIDLSESSVDPLARAVRHK